MLDIGPFPLRLHTVNLADDLEEDELEERVRSSTRKVCYGFAAFVLWSSTTFLANFSTITCVHTALSESPLDSGIAWAIILTIVQAIPCVIFTDLNLCDTRSRRARIILLVKMVSHVLSFMATNFSFTLLHGSSTFTIKLLEPIVSAIMQRVVFGRRLSCYAILSIPIVIGGAVLFCGCSTSFSSVSIIGACVAFSSNVTVATRNVAIKLEQDGDSHLLVKLRSKYCILTTTVIIFLSLGLLTYLTFKGILADYVLHVAATGTSSCAFVFISSYTSINIVLAHMSVVSHSFGNIFKRLIVIVLLYVLEKRETTVLNFLGLGLCTSGMLLYVIGKTRSTQLK